MIVKNEAEQLDAKGRLEDNKTDMAPIIFGISCTQALMSQVAFSIKHCYRERVLQLFWALK